VDCGDIFGLAGEQDSLKAAFLVHTMDMLGYDVVNVGERELNFGQRFLLDEFKKTKMDLVSANLVLAGSKKPVAKPYVVRKAGTVKVAFTGLIGKEMKLRQFPGDAPLEVLDPAATMRRLLPELRKKADVVVVLSHLGMTESQKLTIEAPGIDVMVFGHQPGLYRTLAKTQDVITVRGGERGQHIPQVHLVVEDKKITSFDGDVVVLDEKIPADEAMAKHVTEFENQLNALRNNAAEASVQKAEHATASQVTGDRFLGEQNCRRCHEAEFQKVATHPHAHALETLTKNQRDATPECLPCHVVGMGSAGGFVSKQGTPQLANVQCESCHGMGTQHPTEGAIVGPDVCMKCHTHEQNPDFQYDEMVAKIVHWE
jgi:hypothetical protein